MRCLTGSNRFAPHPWIVTAASPIRGAWPRLGESVAGRDSLICAQLHAVLDAGQSRRGPAGRGGRKRQHAGVCIKLSWRTRHRAAAGRGVARPRAHHAGADRAPHRGDAQKHAGSSQSNCGIDAAARPRTEGDRRWRGDRRGHRRANRAAVADARAQARAPVRRGRGRHGTDLSSGYIFCP